MLRGIAKFAILLGATLVCAPPSQAQWVPANGPDGGAVYCFASDSSALLAGTGSGGVFRSMNNGASWAAANYGLPQRSTILSFAVVGSNVFAATEDSGVFATSDNGSSWRVVHSGIDHAILRAPLLSFGPKLFAGIDTLNVPSGTTGLAYSSNDGTSWTEVNSLNANVNIAQLVASGSHLLMSGTYYNRDGEGVFLSTDSGVTWSFDSLSDYIQELGVMGPRVFAASGQNGFFLSTDRGESWAYDSGAFPIPPSLTMNASSFASVGSKLFMGTSGAGVFLSTDSGANWASISAGLTDVSVSSLCSVGNDVFAGTEWNGVFRSVDNGAHWTMMSQGLLPQGVNVLAATNSMLFAGTGSGVFHSEDAGLSWESANGDLVNPQVWDFLIRDTNLFAIMLAGTLSPPEYGVLFRSTDEGANWSFSDSGLKGSDPYGFPYDYYALASERTNLIAGAGSNTSESVPVSGAIFVSTDDGASWQQADSSGLAGIGPVTALATLGQNIFASATRNSALNEFGGILRSTDDGASWSIVDSSILARTFEVSGTNLFAGTWSGVFLTTDSGQTWSSAGLADIRINAFAVSGSNLFAGTQSGVFLSTNNGISWTPENTGLQDTFISSLAISGANLFASGTNMFFATSDYVWRRPLSEMIPPAAVKQTPVSQISAKAYPNPFPSQTSIHFSTSAPGFARVTVVNVLGEEVAQLYSGELSAGEHAFEWNAADAPDGTYFGLIQTSASREVVTVRHE